jgi:formate dehydrogenase major subunit
MALWERWPVLQQIKHKDLLALGRTSYSGRTSALRARTSNAKAVQSICPYCAVGCGQMVFVRDGKISDIEGDPDSPISEGCLCPKGAATFQLVTGSHRVRNVLHRKPGGTEWQVIPLEKAMNMVAERVKSVREDTWEDASEEGNPLRRTRGFAHLGGATLDNEENYLIKKLFTALGAIQIENQARI